MSGWLILATGLVMLELYAQGLYLFLSFSLGCVPAAVGQFYQISFQAQSIIFIFSSLVFLLGLSFLVKKDVIKELLEDHSCHYKSVIDALPGKRGIIIESIEGSLSVGQVKVQGQLWSAQSVDGNCISKGMEVIVIRIEGVRLIVAPSLKL